MTYQSFIYLINALVLNWLLLGKSGSLLYSYLMCSQAIDQNIFPKVLGTAKVFYCPKPTAEGNRTLELFPVPREKFSDLLPDYTLNNCFIT